MSYKSLQNLFMQTEGNWQSSSDLTVPISNLLHCTGWKLTIILLFESPFYFSTQQAEEEEFLLWRNQSSQRQTPFPEVRQQSLTTRDICFLVISMKSHTGSAQFNKRPVLPVFLHRRYFPHGFLSTDGLSAIATDPRNETPVNSAQDLSIQTQQPGPKELM